MLVRILVWRAAPELNGLKATERLKELLPEVRVLILTRHSDSSYVQQLLRSGASGYVLKRSASEQLVRAIKRVAAGKAYLDPAIADQVVEGISARSGMPKPSRTLSNREEAVLHLVALGFLSKEIAAQLSISIKTVETHKANAMIKVGLKNRIDIVRFAILHGWLLDS